MPTTLTSREFNRHPSAATRAAEKGPVIITDRGRPRFVLVDYAQYRQARGSRAGAPSPIASLTHAAPTSTSSRRAWRGP
jgi:prevent-host-death family protein